MTLVAADLFVHLWRYLHRTERQRRFDCGRATVARRATLRAYALFVSVNHLFDLVGKLLT
jgi:hypothetical protein